MTAARVDALLPCPAVVFGSLPPAGRDLDLLVPAAELAGVQAALSAAGAVQHGKTFAWFGAGTAYAVDAVALEHWLPPRAAEQLWVDAEPLPDHVHLRAPAAHHRLLLLARRYAGGMRLDDRKRALLAAAPAEAWTRAAAQAPDWRCADALAVLQQGAAAPVELGRPRTGLRRPRRPHRRSGPRLVALSGLDGSGKSTQAEHLRTALEALGYDVAVEWTKIARDPVLARVARPVKAVLARLSRGVPAAEVELVDEAGERRNHPDGPPPPPDVASLVRRRQPALTWGWTLVVAWANAGTHRELAHRRPRGVVVCDRYVLDSSAHLRYRYGPDRRFRVQTALLRLLSPRPACAVFLDIAPETARARKPEQYTTADLARLRALYLEQARGTDVLTLDGERPEREIAAVVAQEVWSALTAPRRAGRRLLRSSP